MAADTDDTLPEWSTTEGSNKPVGGTSVSTNLDDNLRMIQKVVRGWLATKGSDIASAATTDLGAVEGLAHDITGTTTITSFGTIGAGIWKILKFEGVLTLTYNAASLILLGGANRTTAVGDIGVYISEGSGNWREVLYARAADIPDGGVPAASVQAYAGLTEPTGWLFCYGQAVSRTTYARLFGIISTTYGVGDGSTTFNLPDLRGRVVAGQDDMGGSSANRLTNVSGSLDGDTLGASGGAETVTLTTSHLPASGLSVSLSALSISTHDADGGEPSTFAVANTDNTIGGTSRNVSCLSSGSGSTSNMGSGNAHPNVQPTFILNYIIKT